MEIDGLQAVGVSRSGDHVGVGKRGRGRPRDQLVGGMRRVVTVDLVPKDAGAVGIVGDALPLQLDAIRKGRDADRRRVDGVRRSRIQGAELHLRNAVSGGGIGNRNAWRARSDLGVSKPGGDFIVYVGQDIAPVPGQPPAWDAGSAL